MSALDRSRAHGLSLLHRVHLGTAHRSRTRRLGEYLARVVPGDVRTVLDVGCGDGRVDRELIERRPDLEISGIDVAARDHPSIPVRLFDGEHIPADDRSVDLVMFNDVLHHTMVQPQLLAEAARVSRWGVLVKDHLAASPFDRVVLRAMDWVGNRHNDVPLPASYWSADQWREAFAVAGLDVVHWDDRLELYPWPVNAAFGRGLHVAALARHPGV
jgi:SAM-dependent methyltransferase